VNGQSVALQGTKIVSTPAVGPLRGDGKPVIVVGTNEEYREAPNFASDGNGTIGLFVRAGVLSQANGASTRSRRGGALDPEGRANPAGPYLAGWPVRPASSPRSCCRGSRARRARRCSPTSTATASSRSASTRSSGRRTSSAPTARRSSDRRRRAPAHVPDRRRTHGRRPRRRPRRTRRSRPRQRRFAPIGPGGDVVFVAPGAGFTRLVDAQLPAEQLPHDTHLIAYRATTGASLRRSRACSTTSVFLGSPSIADVSGDDVPGDPDRQRRLPRTCGRRERGRRAQDGPSSPAAWIIASPAVSSRFDIKGQVVA
jgi:hypothetical protein